MKIKNIGDLNRLYTEADEVDREIFAEMRSNVLLVSSEHYARKGSKYTNLSRLSSTELTESQRLRLTKNHVYKISRIYKNKINAMAPGVQIIANNESELQDQKAAELNQSVWQDAQIKYRLKEKIREYCADFVDLGECATKIFWDPNKGEIKGYHPLSDEDGNPVLDEMGQQQADPESPVYTGAFVFERLFAFNLLRAPGTFSFNDAPHVIIRKMVPASEMKEKYKNDADKLKLLNEMDREAFVVFDSDRGAYSKTKDQIMIRETYFRPCMEYPKGYFYISTTAGILEEGELPYGIWPIAWQGFDEYPTTSRGRSIIKVARPFQAEINRAASSQATQQITVGDDKVIYQSGTKLSQGALLPGVRGITYQGQPPTILAGRDGAQFASYIEKEILQMYAACMLEEENSEKDVGQMDPYAMLFRSMKNKAKFAIYGEKFEQFLIDFCTIYLELAKKYLDDDALIYSIGRKERINIPEFRATSKLCYSIKVVSQEDTIETQVGKQLTMNHILQYVGGQLDKDDVGKIIKNMPFGNVEEAFGDFTLDYDDAKNDMLALERGEQIGVNPYENHEYKIKRLVNRTKKGDFKFLPEQVRQAYLNAIHLHENVMKQQAQALKDAESGFIPTGGALVGADIFIPPTDPSKQPKRARIPYQALDWLIQKLEAQGQGLQKLEEMNKGVVAEAMQHLATMSLQPNGQASPGGAR